MCVAPFLFERADEALDLPVPAWCVGRCGDVAGAPERLFEGARLGVGERVVCEYRLGRGEPELLEVRDRPCQHRGRGGAVLCLVLFDIGVAGVVVDYAVQVDQPEQVAALVARR